MRDDDAAARAPRALREANARDAPVAVRYARKRRDARRGTAAKSDGGTKRDATTARDDGRAGRARDDARDATDATTTNDARATTTTARDDARGEANARGLEIVREALEAADAATDAKPTTTTTTAATVGKRTFVFKSRNKLFRNAKAEREHRARLAKLAESRAFFDDVDDESLAEESEEATPKRGAAMGDRLVMSPNGLIEALQGLGLVDNAPELRAKMETKRRESTAAAPRAETLPSGRENAFDRVSNWVSSLPVFTPLKEDVAVESRGENRKDEEDEEESIAETEDELESLNEDVERLVIDDECSPLAALLRACDQNEQNVGSMSSLIKSYVKHGVKKIGEGTYGEAYRGEDGVVMKIVPMGGDALVNGEVQMGPGEIRSETSILKALTALRDHEADENAKNFTDGFIRLLDASVCRGPYSKRLLEAWDKYASTGASENEKPDGLPSNQLYISFACDDGGTDLEHFELRSMTETVAMLFQIVVALSVAEEASQF